MAASTPFSTILVVDDEPNLRTVLKASITRGGHECLLARDGFEALTILEEYPEITAMITDLKMPRMNGVQLMKRVHQRRPDLPIIILTAFGSINNAVEAVKAGAFDYIEKPFDKEHLLNTLARAVASCDASARRGPGRDTAQYPGQHGMIGRSEPMERVFRLIDRLADTPSTILISGESGTGKELVAKALHQTSGRSEAPFIRVNCAAIPENLLESEFFGHEEGAFTGATHAKPGRFELAQGGTILLDEVGELPFPMQAKLLRVLQENEYERVGGIVTLKSDARVIASTNKDLKAETQAGTFREDLFYRLNVLPIELPALRERPGDIPLLCEYFVDGFNTAHGTTHSLAPQTGSLLAAHSWPGNIRELENTLERMLLLAETEELPPAALPAEFLTARAGVPERRMDLSDSGLKEVVRRETSRIERDLISQALDTTSGNVTKAAGLLRISRKGLQNKIRELHIREDLLTDTES